MKDLTLEDYSRMYPHPNPKDTSADRVDYYGTAKTITTEEGVSVTISDVDEGARVTTLADVAAHYAAEEAAAKAQPTEQSGAMREKRDAIPYDLVPFQEITDAFSRVAEFGARKYAPWNWSLGLKRVQLCGSLLRHVFAYIRGQDRDPESGLLHTDHILWNAAALSHNVHWNLEDGRRAEPARAYKQADAE